MKHFERIDKHIGLRSILGPLWGAMSNHARFIDTGFLTANRLTQQKWSQTFFEFILQNMMLSKFMGKGPENIIRIDTDLTVGPGNKITFHIVQPLEESGITDNGEIENNEEAMRDFNFPVEIHERGHGVRARGKMSEKLTAFDVIKEATYGLGRWAASNCIDNDLLYALSGLGNQGTYAGEGTSDILTVNEKAPSSDRIVYAGQTVAGVVSSETSDSALGDADSTDYQNYLFGTRMIDILKLKAQLATPKISPIPINGKWYWVMLIHPYCTRALRAETGTAGFAQIQANANVRGINNPYFGKEGAGMGRDRVFDGAVGVWNDVILYEYERIQLRVGGEVFDDSDIIDSDISVANNNAVVRNLFLGAQAGVIGWGAMWKKYHKNFDYYRRPGTATDALYGVSKTRFADPGAGQDTNTAQQDHAVILLDCCVETL